MTLTNVYPLYEAWQYGRGTTIGHNSMLTLLLIFQTSVACCRDDTNDAQEKQKLKCTFSHGRHFDL